MAKDMPSNSDIQGALSKTSPDDSPTQAQIQEARAPIVTSSPPHTSINITSETPLQSGGGSPTSDPKTRNAPPPPQESALVRIGQAYDTRKNLLEFLRNVVSILLSSLGHTLTFIIGWAFYLAVPIAMVIVGGIYLNDCPIERYIPLYLLIGGSFQIVKEILKSAAKARQQVSDEEAITGWMGSVISVINSFLFVWFILGSVWVYKEYKPNYDPRLGPYCNRTVYLVAFWMISLTYIMLGLLIVGLCTCIVAAIALSKDLD